MFNHCRDSVADDDILQFWQDNVRQYPVLSQVAKRYLAMAASSVHASIEAKFSRTGLIANSKLSALTSCMAYPFYMITLNSCSDIDIRCDCNKQPLG